MTAPTATNIDIIQGQTFGMQVTWADSTTSPPTPIPLTNYRAHMQIRSKPGAVGTPLVELSSVGTSPALTIEPNGSIGVVEVRIPATTTAILAKNCSYDLFVINSSDPTEATRLVYGTVTVYKSVTVNG